MTLKYTTTTAAMHQVTEVAKAVARILALRPELSIQDALDLADQLFDLIAAIPYTAGPQVAILQIAVELLIQSPDRSASNAVAMAADIYWSTHERQA